MKYRVLKAERLSDAWLEHDWVIEIEQIRWFRRNRVRRFIGSCTVWHEVVGGRMKRCGTMMECLLADIWEGAKIIAKRPDLLRKCESE